MASDFGQWERVASELRACREAQQQAWGDVDNALLGRYLAGDVTPEERVRIESELNLRPELRKLTDLVSDVLRDCGPVSVPEPANRRHVLAFPKSQTPQKKNAHRWRQWAAVAAAACLMLGLAYAVLPKGPWSPSANHDHLAFVAPAGPTLTSTAAFHPMLTPGESALADRNLPVGKDGDRKKTAFDPVVFCADGFAEAGASYEKHGDLDMAEFSYQVAYNMREWKLGADAEPTRRTRRNLGEVYQTALSLNEAVASTQPVSPPPPAPAGVAYKVIPQQVYFSAAQLRQRLARQPVRQVRLSVVPILVEDLNEAKTAEDRERLGRALANLGGAAKDALPALDACLRKSDLTPQEREAVLKAKQQLEKAAAGLGDAPAEPVSPPKP
jgi:hypothetical protein